MRQREGGFNNTRNHETERRSDRNVLKILNVYDNIFSQLRKIEGLEDMKLN